MRGHVIVGVMTINTDVDKLYDTDLSDTAWALIAPMLPAARPGGRPLWIRLPGGVRMHWRQRLILIRTPHLYQQEGRELNEKPDS
jgi:hypothetical protein